MITVKRKGKINDLITKVRSKLQTQWEKTICHIIFTFPKSEQQIIIKITVQQTFSSKAQDDRFDISDLWLVCSCNSATVK